jgi:hypothetical protein
LFVGGVLLLENFNVIEFYWGSVWRFWPIFLIIAGINILFSRNKSQVGGIISIAVLVVTLAFLFYRGQVPPENRSWIGRHLDKDIDIDFDQHDTDTDQRTTLFERYTAGQSDKVMLNISGGGTSFELDGATDSLISTDIRSRKASFSLIKTMVDSLTKLEFKMQDKNGRQNWSLGEGGNDVDFRLNKSPEWQIDMNMGAGEAKFDLSDYRVRSFKFDGGAAALDIKMGALLPIADVVIKTGIADVKIQVPEASGCRIKSKTGLSAKDFSGFTKLDDGSYETSNYKTSVQKIFITLDGGLSNFEVKRY